MTIRRNSGSDSDSSRTASRRNNPYAPVTTPYQGSPTKGVVWGVAHQPLIGQCFFLPAPEIQAVPHTPTELPENAVQLQVRQVRFEMETSQLRWLVRTLTGVHVYRVNKVIPGVMTIWVENSAKAERVCTLLHHNVLADYTGFFLALSPQHHDALVKYIGTRQFHTRSQRLPRELLSVTRSSPASRAAADPPTGCVTVAPPPLRLPPQWGAW